MSREVLILDLRARGEQQVETLWREARAEVERFRVETAEQLAAELKRCELAAWEGGRAAQRRRSMSARRRAGEIITRAEQALGARLYDLARQLLTGSWSGDRGELLAGLAAELPAGEWGRVRVHPDDAALVTRLFPRAEVIGDTQVEGGLEVSSRDFGVTIDNTLNSRLARIWSRLLPELLREVRQDAPTG